MIQIVRHPILLPSAANQEVAVMFLFDRIVHWTGMISDVLIFGLLCWGGYDMITRGASGKDILIFGGLIAWWYGYRSFVLWTLYRV